jgi:hypothetical protein
MSKSNNTHSSRRERGLCAQCGRVESVKYRCSECYKKNQVLVDQCRLERIKCNRCVDCNGAKSRGDGVRCSTCKQRVKSRKVQAIRAEVV